MTTQPLKLTHAEMAVIFQQLFGPELLPQGDLFADLKVDEAGLEAARRSLVERGLMHFAPDPSQVAFDPSTLALFQTVTRPQVVGILQIGSPDGPSKEMYFSWTPDRIVRNYVDEKDAHILELLPSVDAIGEAAVRESGIGELTAVKPELAGNPETVIGGASLRAVFMIAANLQAPEQDARAASWLVKDNQLWLITRQEGERGAMEPVTAETVQDTVVAMVNQAIEQTQAAQA